MTYPEALRAYAEWIEKNADLNVPNGQVQHYTSDPIALTLIQRGEAEMEMPNSHEIVYVNLPQFLPLKVQFVVRKSNLMQPAVVNDEVIWKLKPEFILPGVV